MAISEGGSWKTEVPQWDLTLIWALWDHVIVDT